MLKVFNTLTRMKEKFVSLEPGKIKMYVCGPTVYNEIHIGNARPPIVFDTIRNYLEYKGFQVDYVSNITDVDDKLIKVAAMENVPVATIAGRYTEQYFANLEALGCKRAVKHPRVTEYINDIIVFIKDLLDKKVAYEVNGDVYYRVKKFPDYGRILRQSIADLRAGARIEVNKQKEDPLDFALWKKVEGDELAWMSPWGRGRPGWHIECSTLIKLCLGDSIDIHAGGQDLAFPHHENERAQSEILTGQPLAKYWLHNGFVNIDEEKMSKSIGNTITVTELLTKVEPSVLRYFMVSVHYRNPINFSFELLKQAKASLERIQIMLKKLTELYNRCDDVGSEDSTVLETIGLCKENFSTAMDDDFNTANAISAVHELVKLGNLYMVKGIISKQIINNLLQTLQQLMDILGIPLQNNETIDEEVELLIKQRNEARKLRNFKQADEIRNKLLTMDIIIEDTPQGTRWRKR